MYECVQEWWETTWHITWLIIMLMIVPNEHCCIPQFFNQTFFELRLRLGLGLLIELLETIRNQHIFRRRYHCDWILNQTLIIPDLESRGFHSHGGTPIAGSHWMFYIMENSENAYKWMITGGTPMTQETSRWPVPRPCGCHEIPSPQARISVRAKDTFRRLRGKTKSFF